MLNLSLTVWQPKRKQSHLRIKRGIAAQHPSKYVLDDKELGSPLGLKQLTLRGVDYATAERFIISTLTSLAVHANGTRRRTISDSKLYIKNLAQTSNMRHLELSNPFRSTHSDHHSSLYRISLPN